MSFKNLFFVAIVLSLFTLNACSDEPGAKGSVNIEITDGPIDDASVQGTFVTISEVRVNGQKLEGFNKTTIDLMAYQNGQTKLLINNDVDVNSYNEVTLVLDYEQDASGNTPGCYVEDQDGNKYALSNSGSGEIKVNYSFDVEAEQETDLVIDFDLRKSIQRANNNTDRYNFVTEAELRSALRVVNKSNAGIIKGNCNSSSTDHDKVVVYAYKKGTYNRENEVQGQGASNVEFAQAVTSATVDANGDYELHFLNSGDYELHFAAYEEDNTSGKMELSGTLVLDILTSIDIGSISVNASASVTVDVIATGMVGL